MKKRFLYFVLCLSMCYSCNEEEILINETEIQSLDKEYEDYINRVKPEELAEDVGEKIETVADSLEIQAIMNDYIQDVISQADVAKQKVTRAAGASTDLVGVFKKGSCGVYKELHISLDCEDSNSGTSLTGNLGDTKVSSAGNLDMAFCLTEINRYYPGGVLLISPVAYTASYNVGPKRIFVRYHDTEDKNNGNFAYGNHDFYNHRDAISAGMTKVNNDATLAWYYPPHNYINVNQRGPSDNPNPGDPYSVYNYLCNRRVRGPVSSIKYGVLSEFGLNMIHVDDEDSNNKNSLQLFSGTSFVKNIGDLETRQRTSVLKFEGMSIGIAGGKNTKYYVLFSDDANFDDHRRPEDHGLYAQEACRL